MADRHHPETPGKILHAETEGAALELAGDHEGEIHGDEKERQLEYAEHGETAGFVTLHLAILSENEMPPKPAPLIRRRGRCATLPTTIRSEEHTSELQSLMRISYAVFFLKQHT